MGAANTAATRLRPADARCRAWPARPPAHASKGSPTSFSASAVAAARDPTRYSSSASWIYLALGVLRDGTRDILGIWIENTEGAKFWLKVFKDLKTRGVDDVLIAVTDGLKGVPEALAAAFPRTTLQTCVVHLIRNSLEFARWKDRKPLAAALRPFIARRRSPPLTSLSASHSISDTPKKNGLRCTRRPFFLTLEAHQRPTQIRTDRLPGSS